VAQLAGGGSAKANALTCTVMRNCGSDSIGIVSGGSGCCHDVCGAPESLPQVASGRLPPRLHQALPHGLRLSSYASSYAAKTSRYEL
jgi:hypothetical protein